MALEDLGDLIVTVGGDISPLEDALNQIPPVVDKAASAFDDFMKASAPLDSTTAAAAALSTGMGALGTAAADAAGGFNALDPAILQVQSEFQNLQQALATAQANLATVTAAYQNNQAGLGQVEAAAKELRSAYQDLNGAFVNAKQSTDSLTDSLTSLAAGYLTFQTLKSLVEETASAFGNLDRASQALTAITGDADAASKALSQVPALADQIGASIDQVTVAQQKLVAEGVQLQNIPDTLTGIAEAARTMHESFDTAASSFERITESGIISNRNLIALHLTIQDVADAMGKTGEPARVVQDSFKGIADEGDRAAVLTKALTDKMGDLKDTLGNDVTAAWNKVSNAATVALAQAGASVGGWGGLAGIAKTAIKGIEDVFLEFVGVLKIGTDAVIGFVGATGAGISALASAVADAARGNFAAAWQDVQDGASRAKAYYANALTDIQTDWANTTASINKIWDGSFDALATSVKKPLPAIDTVNKALNTFNSSFQQSAQKALDAFTKLNDETGDTSGSLNAINSVLEKASLNWDKLNASSKAFVQDLKEARDEAQAAFDFDKQQAAVDKIQDEVEKLSYNAGLTLAKIPQDFGAAMQAVADGQSFNNLDQQIQAQINKVQQYLNTLDTASLTEAQALVIADSINVGNATIASLQAAKTQIDAINGALKILGTDTSVNKLAAQISGFETVAATGVLTANQLATGLNNIGADLTKTVLPAMQKGQVASAELLGSLVNLNNVVPGLGTTLANAAKQGADAFEAALNGMSTAAIAANRDVNTAFTALGTKDIPQLQAQVNVVSADVIAAFRNMTAATEESTPQWDVNAQAILAWSTKAIPAIQAGATVSDDFVAAVAKWDPAIADIISGSGAGNIDALQAAIAKLGTSIQVNMATAQDAFKTFGAAAISTLENTLALQQGMYDKLVSIGAPLGDLLTAQEAIYQTQLKINAAEGGSADTQLLITERLQAAKAQQDAFNQSTQGLATLYTQIIGTFDKAWSDFGKGIGDAIVSGQDFGKAFSTVFDNLKKSLAEFVANYLLGQLKTAIIQNTDLLGQFAKVFNSIFGVAGAIGGGGASLVQSGLQATDAAINDTNELLISSTKNVQTAVQTAAQSTTQALGQITQATSTAIGGLLNLLGDIGDIVSAIAGLFTAIEVAHSNTLLDRIANNTLGMLNILGLNGDDSILGATRGTWQQMQSLVALMWNPIEVLLFDISSSLDDVKSDTAQMAIYLQALVQSGLGAGGGSAQGLSQALENAANLQIVAANQLANTASTIDNSVSGLNVTSSTLTTASTSLTVASSTLATTAKASAAIAGAMAQAAALTSPAAAKALTSGGVGFDLGGVTITPPASYSGTAGSGVTGGAGSSGVQVTVNVQGNVIGSGGMQQLSDMVGNNIVTYLRRNAGLIKA